MATTADTKITDAEDVDAVSVDADVDTDAVDAEEVTVETIGRTNRIDGTGSHVTTAVKPATSASSTKIPVVVYIEY